MANKYLEVKDIARMALPRLIENLVMPNLISKDYSADYVPGKGATVLVRKPPVLHADDFSDTNGVQPQDVDDQENVPVVLDKLADVSISVGALEGAVDFNDVNRQFVEPATVALAEKINSDGLELYKDIPYIGGTAGTTPDDLTDFAEVRRVLNDNKVPTSGRVAVWDTAADAKFTTIPAIVNAEKSGTTDALREGSIGRIFGLDNYMSQAIKHHVTGITAATAVKVNGTVVAGATKLAIDGTALTGNLVYGDVLTIDGKPYVVTADTAAAASNAIAEVDVYPALPAVADNANVTLIGSHTANLAFNPSAFTYVTRPLVAPQGVQSYVTSYNGISLRVVRGYDMKYKKEMLSMDVLYGFKTMYPELACRYLG